MTWITLGSSVAGTSHRHKEIPCQDAYQIRLFGPDNSWLLIAVADGAGSASHAEIASALACEYCSELVTTAIEIDRLLTREGLAELLAQVRKRLLDEAQGLETIPRNLACTFLVAIVSPSTLSCAQIGDGAVVIKHDDNYRPVIWPEAAEYVNVSDFLTDSTFSDRMKVETIPTSIDEIAVLTDGLQRLALDFGTNTAYEQFFRPIFHQLKEADDATVLKEPLREFLDSKRVNDKTDDDKTLVLAIRKQ